MVGLAFLLGGREVRWQFPGSDGKIPDPEEPVTVTVPTVNVQVLTEPPKIRTNTSPAKEKSCVQVRVQTAEHSNSLLRVQKEGLGI